MNALRSKSLATFFLAGFVAILYSAPAIADVGARLYIQGWDPTKPDQIIVTKPYEDPKVVTNIVGLGWTAARATICDNIIDTLRAANGGSQGISFKEINCDMARGGDVSMIALPSYPHERAFMLRFFTRGNYLDMHSTTPSLKDGNLEVWAGAGGVLGGQALGLPGLVVTGAVALFEGLFGGHGLGDWADPEFKITYDLTVDVGISKVPTLTITNARATVSNVQANPANAPGSIIKAATDFAHAVFGTPAFSALVNRGVEAGGNPKCKSAPGTFAICFTDDLNAKLNDLKNTVNNLLNSNPVKVFGNPVKLISLGLWGSNNLITFAFGPGQVPLPLTGVVQGMIRMMKTKWFSDNTCPTAPGLVSDVIVGPAPIVDVDPLTYGVAPVASFGAVQYTGPGKIGYARNPATGAQYPVSFDCPYRLVSIPGLVRNFIHYSGNGTGGLPGVSGPTRAAQGSGPHASTAFSIKPIGWDPHVVPNPILTGRDWEASVGLSLTGSITNVQTKPYIDKGDPYKDKINPAQQINPGISVNPSAVTPGQTQKLNPGVTQGLNPQPLPPKVLQQQGTPQR